MTLTMTMMMRMMMIDRLDEYMDGGSDGRNVDE